MFDTWTDERFRALYDAVQAAVIAGSQVIEWQAGETSAKKETVTLTNSYISAVNAEFRARFPSEVGRTRRSRTVAAFSA